MSAIERGGNQHFRRTVRNELSDYDSRAELKKQQYAPYPTFAKKIQRFEQRRKRALTEVHGKNLDKKSPN